MDDQGDGLRQRVEAILPYVISPAQYTGGEVNSIRKDPEAVEVSFCLAFPDTYALGMSHLGLKILYDILNRAEGVAAERVYCPWPDMAAKMREAGVPLYSLESFRPVREFDVLGFSLQYELTFTNVLMMLELAGIPASSARRGEGDPLVIAGGCGAFNPEPLAEFVDAFVLGDGEDAVVEIAGLVRCTRGMPRAERLLALAREVEGVYVPRFYEVSYAGNGTVAAITPAAEGVPEHVTRRVVRDLDAAPYPTAPVVPFVETVHDRYAVEIMRGCAHACRFCQASVNYRPRRERTVERIAGLVREGIRRTGYDEVGLASLSTGDYSRLAELTGRLTAELAPQGVSLSLPSLHVDALLRDVPRKVAGVRRGGLTIAPECASDRMRRSINKPMKNDDLYAAVGAAYEAGWETVKLYFMIGLPGETDEEARRIADMANEVCFLRKRTGKGPAKVNLSVASFVPKPHTPFQWEAMASREELARRRQIVASGLRSRRIRASFHDVEVSVLECVFSRGDRRLGRALAEARARGCAFDAWTEQFKPEAWREAFAASGLDEEFYTRARGTDETLPWSHIDGGASAEQLARERDRAREALREEMAPQERQEEASERQP